MSCRKRNSCCQLLHGQVTLKRVALDVRDVIATHMLKHTGSYEQAGYAIQDTAASVASHYERFLPQDKAALAAKFSTKSEKRPTNAERLSLVRRAQPEQIRG
jgi:hypothetical protein